jgi:hypothetical protein
MGIRCTIHHGDNDRRESCVLAAAPRVGETIALELGQHEFVVNRVTHVATPRSETEPQIIVHATRIKHAHRS